MTIRPYNPETDLDAVRRIWRECGWLEKDKTEPLDRLLGCSNNLVGELNGEAETLVINTPGTMRYLNDDLSMCAVAAVTTSRIARKQKLAGRVTALAIANDVAAGAEIAALGMFEQGYYNRLGFGTLDYDREFEFDPSSLLLPEGVASRPPRRLKADDYKIIHANRLARRRGHGACSLLPTDVTGGSMRQDKGGFGLGYFDGPGDTLSHHLWCQVKDDEYFGPYIVRWMAYQTNEQLLELLALLRNLGDQVLTIKMIEPPGLMMQDLLVRPMRPVWVTENAKFKQRYSILAWQQARICDLAACVEKMKLPGTPGTNEIRFNLELSDPISNLLADDAPWRGVAGEYIVTFGASSGLDCGSDDALPTLKASVNAFTRLWLGVVPASGLSLTETFSGPAQLIEQLDEGLRLPRPAVDWQF